MIGLTHEAGRAVTGRFGPTPIFRYVYGPDEPTRESRRPYLHPVRTLGGDLVTLYRPHDHVWHKGIAWSLCSVGTENFWGGPTYVRGQGYQQLPNNGEMRHREFTELGVWDGVLRVGEVLDWDTESGERWILEHRDLAVAALPARGAWRLSFATSLRNVSGASIPLGSPTTNGRANAGYSGLFWRGPRSFSGGTVLAPDAEGGDELMGRRGPWLAYVGRHDGHGRYSSLVFTDHPANPGHPTEWFVRTQPYACLCPAPFFSAEYVLGPESTVDFRYDVYIVDGRVDHRTVEALLEAV